MGFRFQKRISILPEVRINLSKSGLSTSVGPKGADVNIGRNGITTNAGLPGTGLSYRSKLGGKGGGLGILALVAGLGFAAFKNSAKLEHLFAPAAPAVPVSAPAQATGRPAPMNSSPVNTTPSGVRYVHRDGSVFRDKPKASGHILKKESKGVPVTLLSQDDGWAKVTDGDLTGYMRASVLGQDPPR